MVIISAVFITFLIIGHIDSSDAATTSNSCGDAIQWKWVGRLGTMKLTFPSSTSNGWEAKITFNGNVRFLRSRRISNIECNGNQCTFRNRRGNTVMSQNQVLQIRFRTRLRRNVRQSDVVSVILQGKELCHTSTSSPADPSLLDVYESMSPPMTEDQWHIHDPSKIVEIDGYLMIACTGKAQEDGYNCGLETWYRTPEDENWKPGQCLLQSKPSWVSVEVPQQDGAYWAPALLDSKTMYYSMSNDNADCDDCKATCIGRLTATGKAPNLKWTDMGQPISCTFEPEENGYPSSIDPATFIDDKNGKNYLIFGGGSIWITELDPNTGHQIDDDWWEPGAPNYFSLANGPGPADDRGWIEASYLHKHRDDYYLFVNWYDCCMGVDSTYEIHIGRSTSGPTGPFYDKLDRLMLDGKGSLLLGSEGRYIGPGHASIFRSDGRDWFSYHYYDGEEDGIPWIETRELVWEQHLSGIWPRVTDNKFDPNDFNNQTLRTKIYER